MIIVCGIKEIAYSVDLLEKAVSLIEKGKSKDKVADLLALNKMNLLNQEKTHQFKFLVVLSI